MTLAVLDLLAVGDFSLWLAERLQVPAENVANALWVSLLSLLLFATIQFVTMMVTRWGDSEPTGKAFMCSVLFHLSLAFGAVAVTPPAPVVKAAIPEKPAIREVFIEGDEQIQLEQTGNTRIFEQLPKSPDQPLSRTERSPLDFKPLEGPARQAEQLTALNIALPDVRQLPDQPLARPEIQDFGDAGPLLESAAPAQITESTAEARPDVNVPTMSPVRRRVRESGLKDLTVERTPSRGSVDQIAPQLDVNRELAALDLPADPTAFLKQANAGDAIIRRSAPAPAELPDENPGTAAPAPTEDSATGALGSPKFSRLRTRTPKMEELGGVQRLKPDLTPQTPNPVPSPVVAVRTGLDATFPKDGPEPNVVRPNFDPITPKATTAIPPTYRLRSLAQRQDTARRYGGTDESERAVEASLKWLALHQDPEGFWDADGFSSMCPEGEQCTGRSGLIGIDGEGVDRQFAGRQSDAGVTGLAILAYLGAGYTHEEGQYADQVDRALNALVRHQREDGFLGGEATRYAQMYCHAISTYALAEALGMQTDRSLDQRLKKPLERAVAYIVANQNPEDGGWRYVKGQRSDMSMFGWQLMALKSAEIAGVSVPEETKELMIGFLRERSLGENGGLAAYRLVEAPFAPEPPTPSMTAEAMFCKQMLGMQRENPQSREAMLYLMDRLPERRSEDLYYWYYGTLAMYQYGGEPWRVWNSSLRDYLVADQRTTGHAAGSWDPKPPWGPYGGRVFSTAVSTLCLEVYYRFLPLYQMRRELSASPDGE